MEGIRVHLFGNAPLNDATARPEEMMRAAAARKLEDRVILCHGTDIRLNEFQEQDGLILLDFSRYRWSRGPGTGSHDGPVRPVPLEKGQTFVEQTAALFDPRSAHYVVEYNHFGVRAGRIAEYLSRVDDVPDNQYTLEPRFDPEVEQRLQKKSVFRKLKFRIDTDRMASSAGGGAVTDVIRDFDNFGAKTLEVTLGMGYAPRDRSLDWNLVKQAIVWLKEKYQTEEDAIRKIEVTGRDPDDESDTIDLIAQRLHEDFRDLTLDEGRRFPLEERWNALLRAHRSWKQKGYMRS